MLDPDATAEPRMVVVGHVSNRPDVRIRGLQAGVDEDAVVDREPRGLGERGRGRGADPDDDGVAVGEILGGDSDAEPQVDAVAPVEVGKDLGDLGAEHPHQREVSRLEDGDLRPGGARCRRHFQADPPGSDDPHPSTGAQRVAEAQRILDRPERVHRAELVDPRQPPRRCPRGQQQALVRKRRRADGDRAGGRVDGVHRRAEAQVDVVRGIPLKVVHLRLVGRARAEEDALG